MTGKIFTFFVLDKFIVFHYLNLRPWVVFRRIVGKYQSFASSGMGKGNAVRPEGNLAGVI